MSTDVVDDHARHGPYANEFVRVNAYGQFQQLCGIIQHDTDFRGVVQRACAAVTCSNAWIADCNAAKTTSTKLFVAVRPLTMACCILNTCYLAAILFQGAVSTAYADRFDVRLVLGFLWPQLLLVCLLYLPVHLVRLDLPLDIVRSNNPPPPFMIHTNDAALELLMPLSSTHAARARAETEVYLNLEPRPSASNWRWFFTIVGLPASIVMNVIYIVLSNALSLTAPWRSATDGSSGAFWVTIGIAAFMIVIALALLLSFVADRKQFADKLVFTKPKSV